MSSYHRRVWRHMLRVCLVDVATAADFPLSPPPVLFGGAIVLNQRKEKKRKEKKRKASVAARKWLLTVMLSLLDIFHFHPLALYYSFIFSTLV